MIGGPHARPATRPSGRRHVPARRARHPHRPARRRGSTTRSPTSRGVRVGHATLIEGDGPLVVGRGPGPDRRHGRHPARRRRLDGARVRRLPPAQRQRRAHRPRVDPRGGPARRRRSRSRTRTASASSATRSSPTPIARRPAGRRPVVAAGRRRDVGRAAQRHRRPPRPAGARRRGDRAARDGPVARGQRRRRDRDGLPRVQGRDRDRVARRGRRGAAAGRSASSSRRTTASASSCAIDGVPVGVGDPGRRRPVAVRPASIADERTRRRMRPAPTSAPSRARARSSSSSRPTPRSCPTSASGSPSGRRSASRRMGSTANHSSGDLSSPSRPATAGCRDTTIPSAGAPVDARRADGRSTTAIDAAVRGDGRGDRGGDRQCAAGRRDDDRPRRDHRPRPGPRAAARRHGPLRPRAAGRQSARDRRPAEIRPATVDDLPAIRRILAAHGNDGSGRARGHRRAVPPSPHRQPPGAGHDASTTSSSPSARSSTPVIAVQLCRPVRRARAPRPGHRPAAAVGAVRRARRGGRRSRPTTRGPCRSTSGPGMSPLGRASTSTARRRRIEAAARARASRGADRRGSPTLERGVDGRVPRRRPCLLGDAGRRRPVRRGGRRRAGRRGLRSRPPGVRCPGPRPARRAAGRGSGRAGPRGPPAHGPRRPRPRRRPGAQPAAPGAARARLPDRRPRPVHGELGRTSSIRSAQLPNPGLL